MTSERLSSRKVALTFLHHATAITTCCTLIFTMLFVSNDTAASTTESKTADDQKGDQVITAVDEHEAGYIDFRSDVTMILEDASGSKKQRQLRITSVEITPLGDHRKFVFDKPNDIKGTSVLIHSKVVTDDNQWIYLPAFKRVKRISSTNKSTPFLGSEFSYEDLASQEREKYQNTWVGTAEVDGLNTNIVERKPLFKNSAYKHIHVYVDEQHNRFRKVEYFDLAGELLKTQSLQDYNIYQQRYHLPGTTTMTNHQTGKKTVMLWKNIQLNNKLSGNDFTVAALKRQR